MTPTIVKEDKNQLFTTTFQVDPKNATMYSNLTGHFPLCSVDGMVTVLIIYDWTSNAVLVMPIKDAKDEILVNAFKT